jgi:hypothetical protein
MGNIDQSSSTGRLASVVVTDVASFQSMGTGNVDKETRTYANNSRNPNLQVEAIHELPLQHIVLRKS